MSAVAQKFKSTVSTKNFIFGFSIAVLFYAVLLLGSLFLNQSSLDGFAEKLASETVKIERGDLVITEPAETHDNHANTDHAQINEHHNIEEPAHGETAPIEHNSEQTQSLPLKAVSGLYELNSQGVMLPIIRDSDKLTPFQAYSAAFTGQKNFTKIALVIEDFGLAGEQPDLVSQLPANTSFVLSPYSSGIKNTAENILQNGHEIWMKVPFETINFPESDPGPKGILKRSSLNTNQENLKWVMGQTEVFTGIAAYTDAAFSGSNPTMNTLSREIMNRGLGFFEMNVAALPQVRDLAESLNSPYTKADIVLHDQKWNGNYNEALELLENIAKSRGSAVAVLKAHPALIQTINAWSKTLPSKQISIAPLSNVIIARSPKLAVSMIKAPTMNSGGQVSHSNANTTNHEENSHDNHGQTHH